MTSAPKPKLTARCFIAGGTVIKLWDGAVYKKNPEVVQMDLNQMIFSKIESLSFAEGMSGDPKRSPAISPAKATPLTTTKPTESSVKQA